MENVVVFTKRRHESFHGQKAMREYCNGYQADQIVERNGREKDSNSYLKVERDASC